MHIGLHWTGAGAMNLASAKAQMIESSAVGWVLSQAAKEVTMMSLSAQGDLCVGQLDLKPESALTALPRRWVSGLQASSVWPFPVLGTIFSSNKVLEFYSRMTLLR